MVVIDLEFDNKDLTEELNSVKGELEIKKEMLNSLTRINWGIKMPKNIKKDCKETEEIDILNEKIKNISQQNKKLSDEYQNLKNDSIKYQVRILSLLI